MTRARSPSTSLLTLPLGLGLVLGGLSFGGVVFVPATVQAASTGAISGVVSNKKTRGKIGEALVILQCTCLQGTRETRTTRGGLFTFQDLPSGTYTVQVLSGSASSSKTLVLPHGGKARADFSVDPQGRIVDEVIVEATPVRRDTTSSTKVDMSKAANIPLGTASAKRDFVAVVEFAPTAQRTPAGYSIAGTTAAESKYVVDGANVNNPSFGTVGASIVQEFIQTVEVLESGYDAEYGGAAGGQVQARRVSGTNQVRGTAVIRYAPRLALPRFTSRTDEALRVTEVPEYQLNAVLQASGPIIKDKLFWSAGFAPGGGQNSLVQSFYHRVDKDKSGGYEDCPYENGTNDCVDGGRYIQTEKFASQNFKTGAVAMLWQGVIDWAINPRHRIRIGGGGAPQMARTSNRLPYSGQPNSFGGNLATSPTSGLSRAASGIVNGTFMTAMQNQATVGAEYLGRVADDKVEIDAGVNYSYFGSNSAWKVPKESAGLLTLPQMQQSDSQGRNLYDFLNDQGATADVPGVSSNCNDKNLPPGVACPTRVWLSGGAGAVEKDRNHRLGSYLSFTHFFNAAGAHQLKYGTQIEHLARHSTFGFSGHNERDFYDNCSGTGGGEWCYENGRYTINREDRVDNHRYIYVNTDSPDQRSTRGYGRVRKEENELTAIADSLGAGARVPRYDETLTTQNYGVYLQDKWSILSNLSISAGLRWDMQDMRDVLGQRAMFIWDNVAPRVGFVYDWTDEGKSRLYASYGWFYQNLPLQLSNRVFGGLVDIGRSYRNDDCVGRSTSAGKLMSGPGGLPTEYCVDNAGYTSGLTAGAIVPRLKGQYNQQFQVGYEQEVIEDLVLGVRWLHTNLGRAVEDVSTNGGLNYFVANPGVAVSEGDIRAKEAECSQLDTNLNALPENDPGRGEIARNLNQCEFLASAYRKINTTFRRPTRNYDAWTFEVKKRFAKNWILLGSYTYSRLIGNYEGYVDPITGAINLGASAQYDLPELVRNSFGPLWQDAPHRIRLNGFYTFDLREAGRLTLGTSVNFTSGRPIGTRADNSRYGSQYLTQVLPRGSGGRVEPNYEWNVSIAYAYPLPGRLELEVSARLVNVTNAKAVIRVDDIYSFQTGRPIAGGDVGDLKHAKVQAAGAPTDYFARDILRPQGNYGVPIVFQQPLSGVFDIQLRF